MSAVLERPDPHLRAMQHDDVSRVVGIERRVYEFPWTARIFEDCINVGYVCRVFEYPRTVLGYGIMSVGAGECHILNVGIDPGFQGRGLGRLMMERLMAIARRSKARIAFLEVRVSNERAVDLYDKMGFSEIGRRNNYYPAADGGRESALVLAKLLHASAPRHQQA